MITIGSPSMSLNDPRVGCWYTMDVSKPVSPTMNVRQIVDLVLAAVPTVPGHVIKNLVFSAHGSPGSLGIGTGLDLSTMGPFIDVRGKVEKIWITGCLTARVTGPQTARHGDGAALRAYGLNSGDGNVFVSAFARLTQSYVVVPTEIQSSMRSTYPYGVIDSFEGLLLCYNPAGAISWQRRYPSVHHHNVRNETARNPNRE